jgi:DNA-binding response OmpR family regulator
LGSGIRVLVVEDDDATREMLCAALDDAGFDIVAALDGLHALRTALARRPDLILLDLGLPALDGSGYLERWRRRDKSARDVPVIVVSGMKEGRAIADQLGAAQFFAKPYELGPVIEAIRRHARRTKAP